MQLGCSSPRLGCSWDAPVPGCWTWQLTPVAWVNDKVPAEELDASGLELAQPCTCWAWHFLLEKVKPSHSEGRNWWLPPWKCCVQTDYFKPAIVHLVLPKTEVSYSQVMVMRKNVSIKIRILVWKNLIRFPQTHNLSF